VRKDGLASESLARNLAANAAKGEETVHGANMGQQAVSVKSRKMAVFTAQMLWPPPQG
jgi:hypothetical protein